MSVMDHLAARRVGPRKVLERIGRWVRDNGRATAIEFMVNLGVPYLIYRLAHAALGDVRAMIAASAAPIGWSIIQLFRQRRVDALSLLVIAGIGLSMLGFLGGGGVRLLQLREHLVAAAIGLVFLGSAAMGKPLIAELARARLKRIGASSDFGKIEGLRESPIFRRAMMTMTVAWGVGLVAESALSCVLIFVMTIQRFLLVGWLIGCSTIGALTAWTFWYAKRRVRAALASPGSEASATDISGQEAC